MAVDGINNYLSTAATTAATPTGKASAKTSLNMDDFLKLMVAQLQNQDMNNTADTSQYTTQMAQFSMVQALTDLTELTKSYQKLGEEALSDPLSVLQRTAGGKFSQVGETLPSGQAIQYDPEKYRAAATHAARPPSRMATGRCPAQRSIHHKCAAKALVLPS